MESAQSLGTQLRMLVNTTVVEYVSLVLRQSHRAVLRRSTLSLVSLNSFSGLVTPKLPGGIKFWGSPKPSTRMLCNTVRGSCLPSCEPHLECPATEPTVT